MDVRAGVWLTAEEDFALRLGGRFRDGPARRPRPWRMHGLSQQGGEDGYK